MAKKKKQKKTGIAKRKQNKQQKKAVFKKKLQAKKPVQKKLSPSKVKQNLKNLPGLIFEPELEELAFSQDAVKKAMAERERIPDQIEAIAPPEFMEQLKIQCERLKERFDKENDVDRSMMAHAILYFMEQEQAPAYLNQLVVGMYYRTVVEMGNPGEGVTLKELNLKLKEYDTEWGAYLQEKMDRLEPGESAANSKPVEESVLPLLPFESLIEEFSAYASSELNLEEDIQDRTVEDVEALLNDYCEEREITELANLRPRKIRSFLEGWFPRTLNPTQEDMETMIKSITLFYQFVKTKEKIAEPDSQEILDYLKNRDLILSNIDI